MATCPHLDTTAPCLLHEKVGMGIKSRNPSCECFDSVFLVKCASISVKGAAGLLRGDCSQFHPQNLSTLSFLRKYRSYLRCTHLGWGA
jgi:hypothetical protein